MIDETLKILDTLTSDELLKRIQVIKVALDLMKKGIRHPSTKTKPSNIITPNNYEQAELHRLG